MSQHDDEELLRAVGSALAPADIDALAAQRIRARAHAALAAPPHAGARATRWIEPVLVASFAATYLVWAVGSVLSLYQ